MDLPPIGTFLRPIGVAKMYAYAMRVVRHYEPEGHDDHPGSIEYERWGLRDGAPFDDGHVKRGAYINLQGTAIPGVWRDVFDFGGRHRWHLVPLYYRAIDVDAAGQRDLFTSQAIQEAA